MGLNFEHLRTNAQWLVALNENAFDSQAEYVWADEINGDLKLQKICLRKLANSDRGNLQALYNTYDQYYGLTKSLSNYYFSGDIARQESEVWANHISLNIESKISRVSFDDAVIVRNNDDYQLTLLVKQIFFESGFKHFVYEYNVHGKSDRCVIDAPDLFPRIFLNEWFCHDEALAWSRNRNEILKYGSSNEVNAECN